MNYTIVGYKNTESIKEGHEAAMVFPSMRRNVNVGDIVIAVANDKDDYKVHFHAIKFQQFAPNGVVLKIFAPKKGFRRSNKQVMNGLRLCKGTFDGQINLYEGGVVGVKCGSQDVIIDNFLEKVGSV